MKSKICSKCGIEKEINKFYKHKTCKDGYLSFCIDCKTEYTKKHQIEYWKSDSYKSSILRKLFGIDIEQYRNILEKQNGVCAICEQKETVIDKRINKVRRLSVDHDHKTGKVRGLLCAKCNHLLGNIKDNIKILNRSILYLEDKLFKD